MDYLIPLLLDHSIIYSLLFDVFFVLCLFMKPSSFRYCMVANLIMSAFDVNSPVSSSSSKSLSNFSLIVTLISGINYP